MNIYTSVFLFVFVSFSNLCAQEINHDQLNPPQELSGLKSSLLFNLHNGVQALGAPLEFKSNDWINTGLIVGATMIAITLDNTVRSSVEGIRSKSAGKIVSYAEYYGRAHYFLLGGGLMYLGGLLSGNNDLEQTGGMLSQTLIVTGIYTVGLKFLIGRSRPYENEGVMEIEGFQIRNSDNSFPSGHTSTAFAVSTILAQKFDNVYASVLLYGLAGATAFQRIYSDNHWFSDTLLGAALGYFIGRKVYELNTGRTGEESQPDFTLSPTYLPAGMGISLYYAF